MGNDLESRTGTSVLAVLRDPTDPQAWEAFVDRYGRKLLAWCHQWHAPEEDARDVTQDVLTKLAQHLRSYDQRKGRFRVWLNAVTRNAWRDFRRRRQRSGRGSGDPDIQRLLDNQEAEDSLVQSLEKEFDLELFEEAKARVRLRVNKSTWAVFELFAIEGWSGAAVAARFNISPGALQRKPASARR
jgi:RNA polymerase sigma factor (sigma-70 family)